MSTLFPSSVTTLNDQARNILLGWAWNGPTPKVLPYINMYHPLREIPRLPLLGEGIVSEISPGFPYILQVLNLSPHPCLGHAYFGFALIKIQTHCVRSQFSLS